MSNWDRLSNAADALLHKLILVFAFSFITQFRAQESAWNHSQSPAFIAEIITIIIEQNTRPLQLIWGANDHHHTRPINYVHNNSFITSSKPQLLAWAEKSSRRVAVFVLYFRLSALMCGVESLNFIFVQILCVHNIGISLPKTQHSRQERERGTIRQWSSPRRSAARARRIELDGAAKRWISVEWVIIRIVRNCFSVYV